MNKTIYNCFIKTALKRYIIIILLFNYVKDFILTALLRLYIQNNLLLT